MRKGKVIVISMMFFCILIFIAAIVWFMMYQGNSLNLPVKRNMPPFCMLQAC